jgi:hypothetical protein
MASIEWQARAPKWRKAEEQAKCGRLLNGDEALEREVRCLMAGNAAELGTMSKIHRKITKS